MVQTWDGEKPIKKSWTFLVDHFNWDLFLSSDKPNQCEV